jgi:5-methylcytosine-specific restriction endonuclease McrA
VPRPSLPKSNLRRVPLTRHFYSTYEEYLRHPVFLAVRAVAWERDGGRCRHCGAVATEVHHVAYPPWGTFDVPSHLEAICHACHCRIERKP